MEQSIVSKWLAVANFDSPVSQMILRVWQVFVNGALLWIAAIPYFAFDLLVGWQPSHGAIWLGCAALAPLFPAVTGLIAVSRDMITERGYVGATGRRFVAAVVHAAPAVRLTWLMCVATTLFVAYDVALFAGTVAMPASAAAVALTMLSLLCAASWTLAGRDTAAVGAAPAVRQLAGVIVATIRKAYLPLVWLFLLAVIIAASLLPMIGACLLAFAPGLWGAVVALVNLTMRFGM
ncbi:hypothetical protein JS533_006795 [Bifidobacterium amazonense]|uniref:Uncharacterized protein n=1 Tax=Bifidobacterium amazonense TaxID=2809027 RepID=A0ABS9VV66_9BIFI|nr:hypothetical protein [Bifidobacterium amazonense]MCH9275979.1 hypothetical protein [Bifidobacterium amazonense]